MKIKRLGTVFAAACLAVAAVAFVAGCERKEKVIDIETPAGEVEVERSKRDVDVDVDVTR